jgi:hypothetical protein
MLAASVRSLGKLGPSDEGGGAVGDADSVGVVKVSDGDGLLVALLEDDEDDDEEEEDEEAFLVSSFVQPASAAAHMRTTTARIRRRCMALPPRVVWQGRGGLPL